VEWHDWQHCTEPKLAFECLEGKASERKLRLFVVAYLRTPNYRFEDEHFCQAIQLAERMADEEVDESEWAQVREAIYERWRSYFQGVSDAWKRFGPTSAEVRKLKHGESVTICGMSALDDATEAAHSICCATNWADEFVGKKSDAIALLHEIFGPVPFRPNELQPITCTPSVANELEQAGCNTEVVTHLRSASAHVRGCWALDFVLGKP
jgi:hypothetical protein